MLKGHTKRIRITGFVDKKVKTKLAHTRLLFVVAVVVCFLPDITVPVDWA